jgi:SAM-dependent methyltransferase
MVGLDPNEAYIRAYTGGSVDRDSGVLEVPGRKRLGFVGWAERMPFGDGVFDEIRTTSFFHHLPDPAVRETLREMRRCLRPGGRFVIFEDVWPRNGWTRPLAWLTRRFDRGTHMRHERQLVDLFESACPGPWRWSRHTYTYTGLEFLRMIYPERTPGGTARLDHEGVRTPPGKTHVRSFPS